MLIPRHGPLGADRSDWRRRVLVTSIFAVATAAMLRPSLHQLRTAVPDNLGDPTLIAWLLSWAGHALITDPTGYYDAPNFWPAQGTLTYADALLPLAAVFGPVHALTDNWALSLNVTVAVLFLTNLLATYSLLRWLTGSTAASVVAALGFGFSTYFMVHLGNIQLLAAAGLPLVLLLLLRVLTTGRMRDAVLAGLVTCATVLAAAYYGVVTAILASVLVVGWLLMRRGAVPRRTLKALAVAAAVAGVTTVPLVLPYLSLQSDPSFTRPVEPRGGLELADLLTPASGSLLYGTQAVRPAARGHEYRFFPGLVMGAAAAAGLVVHAVDVAARTRRPARAGARTSRRPEPQSSGTGSATVPSAATPGVATQEDRRTATTLLLLAGVACFVCALGPTVSGHTAPFRVLYDHAPGFSGVRVPARLAVGAGLALAAAAAVGMSAVLRRLPVRGGLVAAAAVGIVVLAELARTNAWAPLPADESTLAVYQALAARPSGAAVELPIVDPAANAPEYPYVESPRQLYASLDWHPRVNGYSGYVRPDYSSDAKALNTFPSPTALAVLDRLDVRFVVLHGAPAAGISAFGEDRLGQALATLPPGATALRAGPDLLVDLHGVPAP